MFTCSSSRTSSAAGIVAGCGVQQHCCTMRCIAAFRSLQVCSHGNSVWVWRPAVMITCNSLHLAAGGVRHAKACIYWCVVLFVGACLL